MSQPEAKVKALTDWSSRDSSEGKNSCQVCCVLTPNPLRVVLDTGWHKRKVRGWEHMPSGQSTVSSNPLTHKSCQSLCTVCSNSSRLFKDPTWPKVDGQSFNAADMNACKHNMNRKSVYTWKLARLENLPCVSTVSSKRVFCSPDSSEGRKTQNVSWTLWLQTFQDHFQDVTSPEAEGQFFDDICPRLRRVGHSGPCKALLTRRFT